MKLNKYDREAFVASAMEDVPYHDFNAEAQKLIITHLKKVVPVDLQNTMSKYPEWFPAHTVVAPGSLQNFATCLIANKYSQHNLSEFPELLDKLKPIADKHREQINTRDGLRQKLSAIINSCTTLKQATELLPEFIKYLPTGRDGDKTCRQMPVVANLVTDLMNAGWPKKETK